MNEFYVSEITNKGLFLGVSVAVLIIPVLLIVFFVYFWFGINNSKIEVNSSYLNIKAVFYGRSIDMKHVLTDGVRLIYEKNDKFYPKYRTNGISFSSVNWGWFKLENKRKALLFVTDYEKSVVIPTNLDFDIIISTDDPKKLIAAILNKGELNEIR